MKKTFIIIATALCVTFSGILLHGSIKSSDSSALLDSMVEALTDTEYRVGTGVICAYANKCWCVYYDPFEIYEGEPVSDVWFGPWS